MYDRYGGLIFQIQSDRQNIHSKEYLAKKIQSTDKIKISNDFECIRENDFVSRELSTLAVCEAYDLNLDQVHHLFKLWKFSNSTGTKITHPYYQRLVKLYELERFLPIPLTGY